MPPKFNAQKAREALAKSARAARAAARRRDEMPPVPAVLPMQRITRSRGKQPQPQPAVVPEAVPLPRSRKAPRERKVENESRAANFERHVISPDAEESNLFYDVVIEARSREIYRERFLEMIRAKLEEITAFVASGNMPVEYGILQRMDTLIGGLRHYYDRNIFGIIHDELKAGKIPPQDTPVQLSDDQLFYLGQNYFHFIMRPKFNAENAAEYVRTLQQAQQAAAPDGGREPEEEDVLQDAEGPEAEVLPAAAPVLRRSARRRAASPGVVEMGEEKKVEAQVAQNLADIAHFTKFIFRDAADEKYLDDERIKYVHAAGSILANNRWGQAQGRSSADTVIKALRVLNDESIISERDLKGAGDRKKKFFKRHLVDKNYDEDELPVIAPQKYKHKAEAYFNQQRGVYNELY